MIMNNLQKHQRIPKMQTNTFVYYRLIIVNKKDKSWTDLKHSKTSRITDTNACTMMCGYISSVPMKGKNKNHFGRSSWHSPVQKQTSQGCTSRKLCTQSLRKRGLSHLSFVFIIHYYLCTLWACKDMTVLCTQKMLWKQGQGGYN